MSNSIGKVKIRLGMVRLQFP